MSNIFVDDGSGKTVVMNDGASYSAPIAVPVILPGHFSLNDRVCEVRRNGQIKTFGGDLLKEALRNGWALVRELQKGK